MNTNDTNQKPSDSSNEHDQIIHCFYTRLRKRDHIALLDLWSSVIFIPSLVMLIGATYGLLSWPDAYKELRLIGLFTIFFFLPFALTSFGLFKRWRWARKIAIFLASIGIINGVLTIGFEICSNIYPSLNPEPIDFLSLEGTKFLLIFLGSTVYFLAGLLLLLRPTVTTHFTKRRL